MSEDDMKYLMVSEVAKRVRVSKMTIYRLVHTGELDAIRIGRSIRILNSSVESYLRENGIIINE